MTFRITTYKAFSPSEVSGLQAWWDASTLTGLDGDPVSTLLDQSGNYSDMAMETAANKPTLRTNALNNRNVIELDGVSDYLQIQAPFDIRATSNTSYHNSEFSHSGEYLAHLNGSTAPNITVWKRNGVRFNKIADFTVSIGTTYGLSWSHDDSYLAIGTSTSPRIYIYKRSGDTFTKLSNPASIPSSTVYGCDFSSDSTYLAVGGAFVTPYQSVFVYKRSGDVFTALSFTSGTTYSCYVTRFSPDTNFLACGFIAADATKLRIYQRSGDVFTILTAPATLPSGEVYDISWLSETVFAVVGVFANILIYEFDGTKFELQQSISFTSGIGYAVSYSRNKNFLAVATNNSTINYAAVYKISGNTYTLQPNLKSPLPASGRGVSWGFNDEFLSIAHQNAPNNTIYKVSGDTFTSLRRLDLLRNAGGVTMFMVLKHTTLATNTVPLTISIQASTNYRAAFFTTISNKYQFANRILDADSGQSITTSGAKDSNWTIICGTANLTTRNRRLYINGAIDVQNSTMGGTGSTFSDTDSSTIYMGRYSAAGYQMAGQIAETLVFNRQLTDTEIEYIHKYLSVKWGITLAT